MTTLHALPPSSLRSSPSQPRTEATRSYGSSPTLTPLASQQRDGMNSGTIGLVFAVAIGFLLASNSGSREQIQNIANQVGNKLGLTPNTETNHAQGKSITPNDVKDAQTPEQINATVAKMSPKERSAYLSALKIQSDKKPELASAETKVYATT